VAPVNIDRTVRSIQFVMAAQSDMQNRMAQTGASAGLARRARTGATDTAPHRPILCRTPPTLPAEPPAPAPPTEPRLPDLPEPPWPSEPARTEPFPPRSARLARRAAIARAIEEEDLPLNQACRLIAQRRD
jgi:hypothetical protein